MKWLIITLAVLVSALPAWGSKSRGVWFWRDTVSPYGSAAVVGTAPAENQTVAFFNSRNVRRVYGSYTNRPVTEPAVIAAWNAKLDAAGIVSQFLMSENTWIFPANRPDLLTKITERMVDFNNAPGRTAAEKFDGLHLDIEPQGLPEWGTATAAQKRGYLIDLRDTYADVRAHLTSAGMAAFPVYADLPVWFDNLPVDGGSVGWLNAADRDAWFAAVTTSLTGVSLMPFDRTTFSSINNGVTWERANPGGAVIRCGIEADIGIGGTWGSVADFNAMVETMEAAYGPGGAVDVQSYRLWREAIAAQPLVAVQAVMQVAVDLSGGTLEFPGETGWTHVILSTSDLCAWKEVRQVKAVGSGPITQPLVFDKEREFWRVERFQEFTP